MKMYPLFVLSLITTVALAQTTSATQGKKESHKNAMMNTYVIERESQAWVS